MTLLHIKVEGKTATYLRRDGAIVCDNDDYRIAFIFDDEWASYTEKTARFICKGEHYDVKFVGSEVAVPALPDTTEVTVGLYVPDAIRTTTSAVIPCLPSVLSRGTRPSEAYAEPYVEPILAAAHRVEVAEENAAAHASGAAASAESAANAATTAEGHAADAARSAQAANRSAGAAQTAAGEAIAAATAAESVVVVLTKRIVNLEKGITPDPYHVDDTVAYRKVVPVNALPYAQIDVIGGMTHKGQNLFHIDKIAPGQDAFVVENGKLTVDVYSYAGMYGSEAELHDTFETIMPTLVVGGTYTISWRANRENKVNPDGTQQVCKVYPHHDYASIIATTDTSCTFTLTRAGGHLVFEIWGNDLDGLVNDYVYAETATFSEIMVNAGSTALPYDPYTADYFEETKVTGLEIQGKNLFDESAVTGGETLSGDSYGGLVLSDGYIRIKTGLYVTKTFFANASLYLAKGTALTISADLFIPSGGAPTLQVCAYVHTAGLVSTVDKYQNMGAYGQWQRVSFPLTVSADGYCRMGIAPIGSSSQHSDLDLRVKNIMVTVGTSDSEFAPYRKHTIPIPAEVRALDGYGWGLSGSVYNGIEWDENGKATFVKRVGRVTFDGTEAWWDNTNVHGYFVCATPPGVKPTSIPLSNRYLTGMPLEVGIPCIYFSNTTLVIFPGTDATTVDGWKAKLSGWATAGDPLTMYYELATPVVTDISHLITPDNFIEVEGGGTITALNANQTAVPTTVIYQLKPEA